LVLASLCLIIVTVLTSCMGARTLMMTASKTPNGIIASPPISATSVKDWKNQKPKIFNTLETEIYGVLPKNYSVEKTDNRIIPNSFTNIRIEEITLKSSYAPDENLGQSNRRTVEFKTILISPISSATPTPIIMMENFCPNHNVVPVEGISKPNGDYFSCDGTGIMSRVFGYFFGRYITTPPIQTIIDRGYALAITYPSDTFPDRASELPLYEQAPDSKARWGAIGAWAWQFSLLSNHLDKDGRFSNTIAYGHSRYGKSALLALAYDKTIDAAIAHQSGTGGASLSKNKPGETVALITAQYPHWFTPFYAEDNLTLDQHHLLAIIAPRPILLGNAKRDVWSDPEGAFRAAQGATRIYNIMGSKGLEQTRLNNFNPKADIAFWMRPGTHGVVKEDWPAFLEFLDAHFKE